MPRATRAAATKSDKPKATKKPTAKRASTNGGRAASVFPAGAWALFRSNNADHLAALLDGARSVPTHALAAGRPLIVNYFQEPAALGRPDVAFRCVKMHYRIDGEDFPPVEVAAVSDDGEYVRTPTRVDIPVSAKSELEYWFECETTTGETLWDSGLGSNFHASIARSA